VAAMRRVSITLCFVFLLLSRLPAFGQSIYGEIWGNVTDRSSEPIAGANVRIISVQKGTQEEVVTDAKGGYVVGHLLPDDDYNVSVRAPGYKGAIARSITVYADQDQNVSFRLQAGSEGGEVPDDGVILLNTSRGDVSTTFSAKQLQDLPINGRTAANLQLFVPGGSRALIYGDVRENLQVGTTPVQLNGQLISGTKVELDGTEIPTTTQGSLVQNPNLESLSQVQVSTLNLNVELGEATSVINLQTASGTNHWHGTAFGYLQSQFGAAGPANLIFHGLTSPGRNQFGGSLGGPLIHNRLFVFGDFQQTLRSIRLTSSAVVSTQLVRSTCLDPASSVCDLSDYPGPIYDPLNPTQTFGALGNCPANCIPENRVAPQSIRLLNLFPTPNAGNGLYTASGTERIAEPGFDIRSDYTANPKLKFFGRYSFSKTQVTSHPILGDELGGTGFNPVSQAPAFGGHGHIRAHTMVAGFDYEWKPDLILDVRFGFARYHSQVLPYGYGGSPAQAAGIPGLNFGDIFTSLLPDFEILGPTSLAGSATSGNFARFGYSQFGNNCNCPLLSAEQQFQGVSNWTKIKGRHVATWGADLRYVDGMRLSNTIPQIALSMVSAGTASVSIPDFNRLKTVFTSVPPAGHLVFSGQNTSSAANGAMPPQPLGGLGLATFLLGDVTGFQRSLNYGSPPQEQQNRLAFYAQDVFRATPHLTLTYGLRWDLISAQSLNAPGQGAWLNVNTGLLRVAGYDGTNLQGNIRGSFGNLGPSLGITYSPNQRSVLRAGYRRNFDVGLGGLIFGDNVTHNPPVMELQQLGVRSGTTTIFTLNDQSSSGYVQGPPLPAAPDLSAGLIPLQPGQPANVVPQRVRVPTVDAWNVTFEEQLSRSTVFDLAYVGNKGTHVFFDAGPSYDLNQPTISGFDPTHPGMIAASRYPFARFGWTQNINYFGANSSSHYNSLQSSLKKRFGNNFSLYASYTWSRLMDFSPIYFNQDPRLGYGPGDFDRRHDFSAINIFELPFGKGQRFFGNAGFITNRVINGWSLSGTTLWTSGSPFSPTYNPTECARDRDTGPCQPNVVGTVHINGERNGYFTTAAPLLQPGGASGPWQRPQAGTFGNAGRNSLRGPSFYETDLSLAKNVNITEGIDVQFRWDVYNVFNHVNLGQPSSCVDCANGGQINSPAIGAIQRQMQFALRVAF
jgi:hypothetical protein